MGVSVAPRQQGDRASRRKHSSKTEAGTEGILGGPKARQQISFEARLKRAREDAQGAGSAASLQWLISQIARKKGSCALDGRTWEVLLLLLRKSHLATQISASILPPMAKAFTSAAQRSSASTTAASTPLSISCLSRVLCLLLLRFSAGFRPSFTSFNAFLGALAEGIAQLGPPDLLALCHTPQPDLAHSSSLKSHALPHSRAWLRGCGGVDGVDVEGGNCVSGGILFLAAVEGYAALQRQHSGKKAFLAMSGKLLPALMGARFAILSIPNSPPALAGVLVTVTEELITSALFHPVALTDFPSVLLGAAAGSSSKGDEADDANADDDQGTPAKKRRRGKGQGKAKTSYVKGLFISLNTIVTSSATQAAGLSLFPTLLRVFLAACATVIEDANARDDILSAADAQRQSEREAANIALRFAMYQRLRHIAWGGADGGAQKPGHFPGLTTRLHAVAGLSRVLNGPGGYEANQDRDLIMATALEGYLADIFLCADGSTTDGDEALSVALCDAVREFILLVPSHSGKHLSTLWPLLWRSHRQGPAAKRGAEKLLQGVAEAFGALRNLSALVRSFLESLNQNKSATSSTPVPVSAHRLWPGLPSLLSSAPPLQQPLIWKLFLQHWPQHSDAKSELHNESLWVFADVFSSFLEELPVNQQIAPDLVELYESTCALLSASLAANVRDQAPQLLTVGGEITSKTTPPVASPWDKKAELPFSATLSVFRALIMVKADCAVWLERYAHVPSADVPRTAAPPLLDPLGAPAYTLLSLVKALGLDEAPQAQETQKSSQKSRKGKRKQTEDPWGLRRRWALLSLAVHRIYQLDSALATDAVLRPTSDADREAGAELKALTALVLSPIHGLDRLGKDKQLRTLRGVEGGGLSENGLLLMAWRQATDHIEVLQRHCAKKDLKAFARVLLRSLSCPAVPPAAELPSIAVELTEISRGLLGCCSLYELQNLSRPLVTQLLKLMLLPFPASALLATLGSVASAKNADALSEAITLSLASSPSTTATATPPTTSWEPLLSLLHLLASLPPGAVASQHYPRVVCVLLGLERALPSSWLQPSTDLSWLQLRRAMRQALASLARTDPNAFSACLIEHPSLLSPLLDPAPVCAACGSPDRCQETCSVVSASASASSDSVSVSLAPGSSSMALTSELVLCVVVSLLQQPGDAPAALLDQVWDLILAHGTGGDGTIQDTAAEKTKVWWSVLMYSVAHATTATARAASAVVGDNAKVGRGKKKRGEKQEQEPGKAEGERWSVPGLEREALRSRLSAVDVFLVQQFQREFRKEATPSEGSLDKDGVVQGWLLGAAGSLIELHSLSCDKWSKRRIACAQGLLPHIGTLFRMSVSLLRKGHQVGGEGSWRLAASNVVSAVCRGWQRLRPRPRPVAQAATLATLMHLRATHLTQLTQLSHTCAQNAWQTTAMLADSGDQAVFSHAETELVVGGASGLGGVGGGVRVVWCGQAVGLGGVLQTAYVDLVVQADAARFGIMIEAVLDQLRVPGCDGRTLCAVRCLLDLTDHAQAGDRCPALVSALPLYLATLANTCIFALNASPTPNPSSSSSPSSSSPSPPPIATLLVASVLQTLTSFTSKFHSLPCSPALLGTVLCVLCEVIPRLRNSPDNNTSTLLHPLVYRLLLSCLRFRFSACALTMPSVLICLSELLQQAVTTKCVQTGQQETSRQAKRRKRDGGLDKEGKKKQAVKGTPPPPLEWARAISRLFEELAKPERHKTVSKYAPQLIHEWLHLRRSFSVPAQHRRALLPGLYAILASCTDHDKAHLNTGLDQAERSLLRALLTEQRKNSYQGAV